MLVKGKRSSFVLDQDSEETNNTDDDTTQTYRVAVSLPSLQALVAHTAKTRNSAPPIDSKRRIGKREGKGNCSYGRSSLESGNPWPRPNAKHSNTFGTVEPLALLAVLRSVGFRKVWGELISGLTLYESLAIIAISSSPILCKRMVYRAQKSKSARRSAWPMVSISQFPQLAECPKYIPS